MRTTGIDAWHQSIDRCAAQPCMMLHSRFLYRFQNPSNALLLWAQKMPWHVLQSGSFMLWVAIGRTLVSVCRVILKYAALAVKIVHVSPVPGKRPHLIHFRCKTNALQAMGAAYDQQSNYAFQANHKTQHVLNAKKYLLRMHKRHS